MPCELSRSPVASSNHLLLEWVSGQCRGSLHAMRDHPLHGVPLLGGGWGAKLDTETRRRWAGSWAAIVADTAAHGGPAMWGR